MTSAAPLTSRRLPPRRSPGGGERIASMSEENSASVRQTIAAAEHLQELAAELDRSAARFRV